MMQQLLKAIPRALMLATLATAGAITLTACDDQQQNQQGQQAPGGPTQGGKQ